MCAMCLRAVYGASGYAHQLASCTCCTRFVPVCGARTSSGVARQPAVGSSVRTTPYFDLLSGESERQKKKKVDSTRIGVTRCHEDGKARSRYVPNSLNGCLSGTGR